MKEKNVNTYVSKVCNLLSLPTLHNTLLKRLNDPNSTANDIADIIRLDPGLTARILRIVNSAYYSFQCTIVTVPHAITVLGANDLKNLILATSAVDVFDRIPSQLVDMSDFWHHSIYCGLIARQLAKLSRVCFAEELFVAGLLHDIGKLIIYNQSPTEAQQILEQSHNNPDNIITIERKILGFSHAEVSATLFQLWNLPTMLIETARNHHNPLKNSTANIETTIIHIADLTASYIEKSYNSTDSPPNFEALFNQHVCDNIGLDQQTLTLATQYAADQSFDVMELFYPGSALTFCLR